jgi:RNA polymerase sigma-70 factor (ECF subfamily)
VDDGQDLLAARFDADRPHLTAVAYRMLGSRAEAEDAVQEAWFRLSRSDTSEVRNLTAWLTTVVSRVCLDALRSRRARPDVAVGGSLPDPVVARAAEGDASDEAVLADSVGLALLVVLDALSPAERLAYVLHDMFDVPFDEIAEVSGTTPANARQLASRARRRVRGQPVPDAGPAAQRRVVDAFLAAARDGDLAGLVEVLHPDCTLRTDAGTGLRVVAGAEAVAAQASSFARVMSADVDSRPALVNGAAGVVAVLDGQPMSVLAFTVVDGRIVEIDILADRERLAALDLDLDALG